MRNIFLFPLFLFFVSFLQAKQIEVCATCEIKTIKEAISIAKDGDEIITMCPGLFNISNLFLFNVLNHLTQSKQ